MAADMMEYYQQIGELKKAVRERELHRLELEKQALLCAQKRERRHEDFKDKVREIQRELAQKEMEAAQNFQSLLARVDSIRREHQLLAAHTEQLRQRKLQYEMSLRSTNPILHTAMHRDLSGTLTNSGEAAWKGHFQATSTPAKSQLQQPTLHPQPQMSPIKSYSLAPTSHLSPMERYIPRKVNLKANQQQPFTVPITSLSMPSSSLLEESLSYNGMVSHNQQGNMVETASIYNQPSKMDYMIPYDASREPLPHDGMVSHPQGNMSKTPVTYSQPHHVDFMLPNVSRQPLSHDAIVPQTHGTMTNTTITHTQPSHVDKAIPHVTREPLIRNGMASQIHGTMASTPSNLNQPSHVDYAIPHVYSEPLIQSGMVSQTQDNTTKLPTTYIHPSHQGHEIPDEVSRSGFHQNHPTIQPATRDPLEYNRSINLDTPPVHTPEAQVTHVSPHLQSAPNPSATDHYHNQSQHLSGTNSLPTTVYLPKMHNNLPTPTNGVTKYSPTKSISESEYSSPRLKAFSHDSMNHETSSPSLNNTFHPKLDTQYNRVTLPQPTEIYMPQSDLLVNREIPVKDTNGLHTSILRQDAIEVDKVPNNLNEREVTKKTSVMANMDDKPREMFTPRKYYDETPQNDSPVRSDINSNTINDLPTSKLDVTHTGNKILKDSEYSDGRTITPERSTINRSPSKAIKTDSMEPKHDLLSQTEPSPMSASQGTVTVKHEYGQNPNRTHTTGDMNSLLELKSSDTTDILPNKDTNNTEEANRKMSLTQHKTETKQIEFKPPTSSDESPSSASTKDTGPIRATSAVPSQASQKEYKSPDRQYSSSKETPSSPPIKSNSPTRPSAALPPKAAPQNLEDTDTDFFDQNINVTDSAAYKTLVGGKEKGSNGTDSENDEAEGQVSDIFSKPQTLQSRPAYKPFASSIPSLRPALPDTDTDSVDSVEAAIQAAMKKRDQEALSESSREAPQLQSSQSSLKQEAKSEAAAEQGNDLSVNPGMDKVLGKNKQIKTAAVPINLDSECESYEVSGGADASDEDDFDFYDKF